MLVNSAGCSCSLDSSSGCSCIVLNLLTSCLGLLDVAYVVKLSFDDVIVWLESDDVVPLRSVEVDVGELDIECLGSVSIDALDAFLGDPTSVVSELEVTDLERV
jgi:hypothetical protein